MPEGEYYEFNYQADSLVWDFVDLPYSVFGSSSHSSEDINGQNEG